MALLINRNTKINIMTRSKIIMHFGKKREKELLGSSHTKKLKMLNIVKTKLKLNGLKMEH